MLLSTNEQQKIVRWRGPSQGHNPKTKQDGVNLQLRARAWNMEFLSAVCCVLLHWHNSKDIRWNTSPHFLTCQYSEKRKSPCIKVVGVRSCQASFLKGGKHQSLQLDISPRRRLKELILELTADLWWFCCLSSKSPESTLFERMISSYGSRI